MPGRSSIASASHSVSQSAGAPPLALASTHSGLYRHARGKRSGPSSDPALTLRTSSGCCECVDPCASGHYPRHMSGRLPTP